MIPSRQTFVFSKAMALARRMAFEQDKKQAGHTVCVGLLALLSLGKRSGIRR